MTCDKTSGGILSWLVFIRLPDRKMNERILESSPGIWQTILSSFMTFLWCVYRVGSLVLFRMFALLKGQEP